MEFASYINYYVEYHIFWILCSHFLMFLTFKFPTNRYTHTICYVTNGCFSELVTKQGWKDRKQEKQEMEREEE